MPHTAAGAEINRLPQAVLGLQRNAHHQIQRGVVKACCLRFFNGIGSFLRRVDSAENVDFPGNSGLHADRNAVKARLPQRVKVECLAAFGIDLQGDFGVFVHRKVVFDRIEQGAQPLGPQHARCAAAKVDAADRLLRLLPPVVKLFGQHLCVDVKIRLRAGAAEKIAVGTLAFAKGNMQI